ncbi:MAG: hypothetical protein ACK5CE_22880 [Actinomycetes bacterium]
MIAPAAIASATSGSRTAVINGTVNVPPDGAGIDVSVYPKSSVGRPIVAFPGFVTRASTTPPWASFEYHNSVTDASG